MSRARGIRPADYEAEEAIEAIGAHMSTWRRLQGLTQDQVAARAGVARGSLVRLEAGEPGTTMDTFFRILGALHISDAVTKAVDPYRSDIGMARADELLPTRVRG